MAWSVSETIAARLGQDPRPAGAIAAYNSAGGIILGHDADLSRVGRGGTPPEIACAPVPEFDRTDLEAARAAFRQVTPIRMQQAWRAEDEAGFAPAIVRTGWQGHSLLVFAELTDADVFTAATQHNQRFWELGDTFEMFLRPVDRQAYVELHVAPNNLRLQLRFADAEMITRLPKADVFGRALVAVEIFRSTTWVEAGRWVVLAEIPAASVCERDVPLAGSAWRVSFSRYDCTRGRAEPIISSTSPHALPVFHRQQEWGVVTFVRSCR
jgi:hypothetical protein